jgi:hypothetical protein
MHLAEYNTKEYLFLEIVEPEPPEILPEEIPEKPPTPPPIVKPPRSTIFTIIRDFVHRHTHSDKSSTTDASESSSLATSPMSSTMTLRDDTPNEQLPTQTETFTTKQMKNWTSTDVEDFLRKYQFEKFAKILSQAEGNYLFRLHIMSHENNNMLLHYMQKQNSKIQLSDYLRFAEIVDKYAQQPNTKG